MLLPFFYASFLLSADRHKSALLTGETRNGSQHIYSDTKYRSRVEIVVLPELGLRLAQNQKLGSLTDAR